MTYGSWEGRPSHPKPQPGDWNTMTLVAASRQLAIVIASSYETCCLSLSFSVSSMRQLIPVIIEIRIPIVIIVSMLIPAARFNRQIDKRSKLIIIRVSRVAVIIIINRLLLIHLILLSLLGLFCTPRGVSLSIEFPLFGFTILFLATFRLEHLLNSLSITFILTRVILKRGEHGGIIIILRILWMLRTVIICKQ